MSKHSKRYLQRQQQSPQQTTPAENRPIAAFQVKQEAFSGPLPPPTMLAEYDRIIPRGAERIMAMAETQLAHRQGLESTVVNSNIKATRLGQVLGFITAMSTIGGGFYLLYLGKDIYGLATVVTAIAGLVGVFIYGRRREERERAEKLGSLPSKLK